MGSARDAAKVLQFWFGEVPGERRKAWFVKDSLFDAEIRAQFHALHAAAARGELAHWRDDPMHALALIVLIDQFSRNMFRGSAAAFTNDPLALSTANALIASGADQSMCAVERMFVYLPFEHSESLADQQRSLDLFAPLGAYAETADTPDFARRHWEIIKRFGRFPHRNAALGRISTPEEIEFLAGPNSSF